MCLPPAFFWVTSVVAWAAFVFAYASTPGLAELMNLYWLGLVPLAVLYVGARAYAPVSLLITLSMCLILHGAVTSTPAPRVSKVINVAVMTTFADPHGLTVRGWLPALDKVEYVPPVDQGTYETELGYTPACARARTQLADITETYQLYKYLKAQTPKADEWWLILGSTVVPLTGHDIREQLEWLNYADLVWLDYARSGKALFMRGSALDRYLHMLQYNALLCAGSSENPMTVRSLLLHYDQRRVRSVMMGSTDDPPGIGPVRFLLEGGLSLLILGWALANQGRTLRCCGRLVKL